MKIACAQAKTIFVSKQMVCKKNEEMVYAEDNVLFGIQREIPRSTSSHRFVSGAFCCIGSRLFASVLKLAPKVTSRNRLQNEAEQHHDECYIACFI